MALANTRLDFVQTNALDATVQQVFHDQEPVGAVVATRRLALMGSSTTAHLQAGIRVAGLRRGIRLEIVEPDYGQVRQALFDDTSAIARFRPELVLLAFDASTLASGVHSGLSAADADGLLDSKVAELRGLWRRAQAMSGATVLQQTALPVLPDLLGSGEHRLPGSPSFFLERLNMRLREEADREGVHLVSVDRRAVRDGISAWHDAALWHRSKQEISLPATPFYGELVVRQIAALMGRSAKCLVLDLDNTLWGGVIGDDGLDGIVLGQGSATGEAFAAVQGYASALSQRGVILAVCSKNDEAVAMRAFDEHPEMILKRSQIASFVANWTDKAANIRKIASDINIGLDSLVFLDDNPFERALVRQELPMVAVPEVPEDPALVPQCLADAGYFEAIAVTADDLERTKQYQLNRERQSLAESATDMESYLRGLAMRLQWSRFDSVGLARTVQLINKTNQFNLTTRRYTEADVRAVMDDPTCFGLQLRLLDRFGDNGIIAIVIGRRVGEAVDLDTWLMSCRVLGRQVEQATLHLVAQEARRLEAHSLVGTYLPTSKNGMVREHYEKLGFTLLDETPEGARHYRRMLSDAIPPNDFITLEEIRS